MGEEKLEKDYRHFFFFENFCYDLEKGIGGEYIAKKDFLNFFLVKEISSMFICLKGKIKIEGTDQRRKFLEQCAQAENKSLGLMLKWK